MTWPSSAELGSSRSTPGFAPDIFGARVPVFSGVVLDPAGLMISVDAAEESSPAVAPECLS